MGPTGWGFVWTYDFLRGRGRAVPMSTATDRLLLAISRWGRQGMLRRGRFCVESASFYITVTRGSVRWIETEVPP